MSQSCKWSIGFIFDLLAEVRIRRLGVQTVAAPHAEPIARFRKILDRNDADAAGLSLIDIDLACKS